MPIATLTTTGKSFQKLGKIRKGDRGGKNGAPRDLDHFRVTFMAGAHSADLEKAFRATYGPEPAAVNIRIPYHSISEVWDANYECYKQGGLICQAGSTDSGAYWIFYRDPDTSEVYVRNGQAVGEEGRRFVDSAPCDLTKPVYHNAKKEPVYMSPVGRLQVVVPELANIEVGYFEFCPTSPRDIRNLSAELGAFDSIARSYGKSIAGIPFQLIRRKEEVTINIGGKLSKKDSWVVHLTTGGDWGVKAIEAIERLALPEIVDAEIEYADDEADIPSNYPPQVVTAEAKPTPAADPADEQISPFDQRAVEYAAKKWGTDKVSAAKELGRIMRETGRITDPMGKSAFKQVVDGS